MFVLVLGAASVVAARPQRALAVYYPAGWNLVSGPEGSRLAGATGSIFAYQPGDSDYEEFPSDSPLHAGWGYWAYFPNVGGLQAAAESDDYTLTLAPGQWALIGDPSAIDTAVVEGATSLLTYRAGDSALRPSSVIPAQQGAWVRASGTIAVTVAQSPVPPPLTTAPPPLPRRQDELRAVSLQQIDLPGYTLTSQGNPGVQNTLAGYFANWNGDSPDRTLSAISEVLAVEPSEDAASTAVFGAFDALAKAQGLTGVTSIYQQGVGDEVEGDQFTLTPGNSGSTGPTIPLDGYALTFRRGPVLVRLTTLDPQGGGSFGRILTLARIIDGRLTGTVPPSLAAPGAVVAGAVPSNVPLAHTWYTSAARGMIYFYCDDDPAWRSIASDVLETYPSVQALKFRYPYKQLHRACLDGAVGP
jgi:hypothetical protein